MHGWPYQRRGQLGAESLNSSRVLNNIHIPHDDLDGTEHDSGVCVLHARCDTLHNAFCLLRVDRCVCSERVENKDLTPLCERKKGQPRRTK